MDQQDKKVALRAITYGLYVMTASSGGEYAAGGVNWVTQTSFDPPLVAAAVKADSGLHALTEASGLFAVNVLADDQLDIAKAFFRSTEVDYWFECRVTDKVTGGDHTIFVGEVVGAGVRDAARVPLNLRSTGMNYGG
jgi:flavin reductase (DIM6/NTAB) family NADH-FMN oxidoreductase RutF